MDYYAIEIGGTKSKGRKIKPDLKNLDNPAEWVKESIFPEKFIPTSRFESALDMDLTYLNALKQYGTPKNKYIGISLPGKKDLETGKVDPSNIPFEIDLHLFLREEGYKVVDSNDLNASATGLSRLGIGRTYERVMVENLGTGFNSAFAINGIVITESESGHKLADPNSIYPCGCGKGNGHLELFLSGSGFVTQTRSHIFDKNDRTNLALEESLNDYNLEHSTTFNLSDLSFNNPLFEEVTNNINGTHITLANKREMDLARLENREVKEPYKSMYERGTFHLAKKIGDDISDVNPDVFIIRGGFGLANWFMVENAIKLIEANQGLFFHYKSQFPEIFPRGFSHDGLLGVTLLAMDQKK